MSDNVITPVPANTKIAADEVVHSTLGTVKVQYIKLMSGAIDSPQEIGNVGDALKVHLATALSQQFDSVLTYPRGSNYQLVTTSAQFLAAPGKLLGIWVGSASNTPSIKVWDSLTATGTSVPIDTFTPTAGTMYRFPDIRLQTGGYVTIGGTVNCTVFFDPTNT